MNTLDFIESDMRRGRSRRRIVPILVGFAVLCPVVLGLGMRADLVGVFEPRILLPNLAAASLLAAALGWAFASRFSRARAYEGGRLAFLLALPLAAERVLYPVGERSTYVSEAIFWREAGRCFTKGGFEGVIFAIGVGLFAFACFPLPSRRWRLLLATAVGVSGAIMLGFHCDSSSVPHVLLGHVGPGLLTGGLAYLGMSQVFRRELRVKFPRLKNPGKL